MAAHPNNLVPITNTASVSLLSQSSPYQMKESDVVGSKNTPTTKAFHSDEFMRSREARLIRILCEFQEPALRLNKHGVKGTILFFGSARSMTPVDFTLTVSKLEAEIQSIEANGGSAATLAELKKKVAGFKKVEWMGEWAVVVEELARRLTQWSMTDPQLKEFFGAQPDYLNGEVRPHDPLMHTQPLVVTTGGGPGIMEAANKGAASVPGAKTIGMGITLPFEKGLNPFVSRDLAFEFHYFFTRKFWMMYCVKALVIGPGGFGTLDEMFELMTLRQTGKIPDVPIVLLCSKFWKSVINWQALADFGTISQAEVDRLFFADDVDTAFDYIVNTIAAVTSPTMGGPEISIATTSPQQHQVVKPGPRDFPAAAASPKAGSSSS